MKMVRLAEKHLPVDGGQLDQTQSFTDAQDWINTELKRWKAES
jgi:hypothetical protein